MKQQQFSVISKSSLWFWLSSGAVVLSLLLIAVFGLRLGIDFIGGSSVEVEFSAERPTVDEFTPLLIGAIGTDKGEEVRTALSKNAYLIRSRKLSDGELRALDAALATQSDWLAEVTKVTTIGANIGAEFLSRAVWALLLAIVSIVVFVAWAFRSVPDGYSSFKFGVVAIIALAHDVMIIIGMFAVLGVLRGVEIDALFITALLTVLGFSVNDTIVVFDRLREELLRTKGKKDFALVADFAVVASARRSLLTSISTLAVLLVLLYFFIDFESLFFFFFALAAGVVVGTYSSLFLAVPLLHRWHK